MVAFLPSSVAAAHLPISSPALKLSVAKVMSTVSGRVGRGVERDDVEAGVAGLLDRRVHAGRRRGDQDALVAAGDGVLDRLRSGSSSSPSSLPAAMVSVDVVRLAAAAFGALLHGDEERVGRVLVMSVTATSSPPPPPPLASPPGGPASPPPHGGQGQGSCGAEGQCGERGVGRRRFGSRYFIDDPLGRYAPPDD